MNLIWIPIPRICVVALTALLVCLLSPALPLNAASDDEDSSNPSSQAGLDAAALKRVLPGSWKWTIKKGEKDGMTDIMLSFDDNMNVVGSATITGGALLVTPNPGRAPLKLTHDVETGLKSPERGVLLELPLPGIQKRPARLLVRSINSKKIECLDLTDTEKPPKVTLVKTTDRLLSEIAGPVKPTPPPASPENAIPADQPQEPVVAEKPRTDGVRRPALSIFERLKSEQASKTPEEESAATVAPVRRAVPPAYVPDPSSRPILSVFERLKTEQSTKTPEEESAATGAPARRAVPPAYLPDPKSRPVLSHFERLKAERAKKAAEEQAARESENKVSVPKAP